MRKKIKLSFGPGIEVEEIMLRDSRWVLSARAAGERSCPVCGNVSTSRHDWHRRRLQDLPVQGTPLVLDCVWDASDASTNGVTARPSWNACLRSRLPWRAAPAGWQRSFGYSDTLQAVCRAKNCWRGSPCRSATTRSCVS